MAKKDTWRSALAKPGNGVISFHDDKFNWKSPSEEDDSKHHGVAAQRFCYSKCSRGIAAAGEGTKMVYVPAPLAVVVKAMKLLSWMFKCLEQSHMCCKKACLTPSLQELVLSLSLEVSSHRRVDEVKQAKLGFELWKGSSFSRKLLL